MSTKPAEIIDEKDDSMDESINSFEENDSADDDGDDEDATDEDDDLFSEVQQLRDYIQDVLRPHIANQLNVFHDDVDRQISELKQQIDHLRKMVDLQAGFIRKFLSIDTYEQKSEISSASNQ